MHPFYGKPLRAVTVRDLEDLVTNAVPESLHLEYKQELVFDTEDKKTEFLRDLSAFANADGGTLIYGMVEDGGLPTSVRGFAVADCDKLLRALEGCIAQGIDERLPTPEMHFVQAAAGQHVLLIRVRTSLRAPHMVTRDKDRRFHMRVNGGKQAMTTSQIRDAVLRSDSIEQRVREFHDRRIAKYSGALALPFWMLHLVPLHHSGHALDVTKPAMCERLRQLLSAAGCGDASHCLDGFMISTRGADGYLHHGLAFRDGAIEFADWKMLRRRPDGTLLVPYTVLHRTVVQCLGSALELYKEGILSPPSAVAFAMVHVRSYALPLSELRSRQCEEAVIAPDPIIVTDVSPDPWEIVRPLFDVMWNAFGEPRCPGYNDAGRYEGPRT